MSKEQLAQLLYEKHQQAMGHKKADIKGTWDNLPDKERKAWIKVARYVIYEISL